MGKLKLIQYILILYIWNDIIMMQGGKWNAIKTRRYGKLILADGWIFKNQEGSHKNYVHPIKQGNPEAIAKELDPEAPMCKAFVNMVPVDVALYAKEHFKKPVQKTLTIPV